MYCLEINTFCHRLILAGTFSKAQSMPRISGCLIFICASIFSCSRTKTEDAIFYPGDGSPGDSALLFAYGSISTDSFEHSSPAFSPDGKIVLWSVVDMPSWKANIYEMEYEKGTWTTPYQPSFCDTTASDIYPSFSPDGRTLYFSSSRKLPSGQFPSKGNVIWRSERTASGWSTPVPLDSGVSSGGDYSPSVASNGSVYFTHGPFRSPDWNILTAPADASAHPAPLPPSINTTGYEDGPFIAADESYIIFESDRPGGVGGSIDLYISFKTANGTWNNAVNMGPTINTKDSERFARVSPDGRYLFFGSDRRRVNGQPNFDIYWVNASLIDRLRPKNH